LESRRLRCYGLVSYRFGLFQDFGVVEWGRLYFKLGHYRRIKVIDARHKRKAAQVHTCQVYRGRRVFCRKVSGREVDLTL
jgi:hypothetical protein